MKKEFAVDDNDAVGSRAVTALALLRLTLGAMFVWVFFENLGKGLYSPDSYAGLVNSYVERGCAPGFWKGVMSVVANNAAVMGPVQAVTEITFGVCLLLGLFTRPVALGAFAFLASLWVSEWCTAWIWELLVPMAVALSLALGAAGRRWGVDAALAKRFPNLPIW
ncbi:MAG: DoxX family membrane protein [Acidobacteria bacterium]|nr:DoxX family membrane protein [Acidobacteriota bacterium]